MHYDWLAIVLPLLSPWMAGMNASLCDAKRVKEDDEEEETEK